MIQQIGPDGCEEFVRRLGCTPFFSSVMAASFAVNAGKNTGVRFFLADDAAALSVSGENALVCGEVRDAEELDSFLAFSGVRCVRSSHAVPSGFAREEIFLMTYTQPQTREFPSGMRLEEMPRMTKLGESMRYTDGTMSSDDFIAEACARRNRGLAHIFALEAPDGYAATAGVYALCAHEAYLGGVVTREEYRGRGCAGALVLYAANRYAPGRAVRLICAPERRTFYESIGFSAGRDVMQWRAGQ